jgi:hypothetical protein
MHFFKAFKENLENLKSPYVKRSEPVLGINKKAPRLGEAHLRLKRSDYFNNTIFRVLTKSFVCK